MIDELFLIAHKVRGEPAFDVAIQMQMPDGVWWIIPTSGHRAYPAMSWPLKKLCHYVPEHDWQPSVIDELGPADMSALRDHYAVSATPAPVQPKKSLNLADLGL